MTTYYGYDVTNLEALTTETLNFMKQRIEAHYWECEMAEQLPAYEKKQLAEEKELDGRIDKELEKRGN